jgi:hypothetical protein
MAHYFSWLRCNDCGWEHERVAMANACGGACGHYNTLHVISNCDGEIPRDASIVALLTAYLDGKAAGVRPSP